MRAEDVQAKRFSPVKFREGYDMADVDAFLARVQSVMAADDEGRTGAPDMMPEDVVNARFTPTKFREGYHQDQVDDFLDEIVADLHRRGL
nr:DivIVA domain-containing protein [Frigoribacterium sp. PvP032]